MEMWIPWKNSYGLENFIYKDCGAGGDCQMLSIAECILPVHKFDGGQIRHLMANKARELTHSELVENILPHYLDEIKCGTFRGNWDPRTLKSCDELAAVIAAPLLSRNGNDFQGDALTLRLIAQALGINIFVFDSKETFVFSVLDAELYEYTILLLLYQSENHYRALGIRLGDHVQTIFMKDRLPFDFKALLEIQKRRPNPHSSSPHSRSSSSHRARERQLRVPGPLWGAACCSHRG